ncbi:M12 family metallopeptidase [Aquimarina agarilytica]|uniref:M12 family metallopeptidase n=1 Tax=Aquimarina agarilytica TaxID=1087449 RepID=UPI0002894BAF|nr:M12 family metallopeptidase [Aquimarina agarilytica]
MKFNKLTLTALAVGTLWSCQKDDITTETTETPNEIQSVTKNFLGTDIKVTPLGNETYSNGDILFDEEQFLPDGLVPEIEAPGSIGKLGEGAGVRRWANNTVVYVIQNNLSTTVRNNVFAAMEEWTSKTNVKFKERTNESTYVTVRSSGATCNCGNATLGSRGNRGTVNLGSRSSTSLIVHEFGHTLGFLHEQNRPDRDNFITVNFDAIQDRGRDQYFISRNSTPLTNSIDFNSIMMYNSTTFAKSRSVPTMTRKDNGQPVRGAGNNLTQLDIQGTNAAYPASTTSASRCDGVEQYDRNRRYRNGDKVIFRGDLYEAINFRFVNQGPCN